MKILDSKTVVVTTSEELKSVLEEDNGYSYIYFGNDITLESGIVINNNKESIVIDGTYLDTCYTYTGMVSTKQENCIAASPNNKKIVIKNINIIHTNTHSVIYVRGDHDYDDIYLEYNNITFVGVQLVYNPFGSVKIKDSNITMKLLNEKSAEEVAECKNILLEGNITIRSSATNSAIFAFRYDTPYPTLKILPYSVVNITSENQCFVTKTTTLNMEIMHDSEFNLTTVNGFSNSTNGVNNALIDERATFNFIENSHIDVPMWNIYGTLTVNEGSSLFVINSFKDTPTDNYNIYFKEGSNFILNNPKEVVLYNKNAPVLHTDSSINFSLKLDRINMWEEAVELASGGTINNLPDYAWYKEVNLISISGTFEENNFIIDSHNLTEEEINKLPDLSNFIFNNKKVISIGSTKINIHPINSTTTSIGGHTKEISDILIKYNNQEYIIDTNDEMAFEHNIIDSIPDGTEIEITSCVPGSFIYKTRTITTPFSGELTLMDSPSNVPFVLNPIQTNPIVLPKKNENIVKVIDSRTNSSDWKLYVHLTKTLTSKNNFTLPNAIIFKKLDNGIIILNEIPSLIYTGFNSYGNIEVYNITWSTDKGLLLRLDNNYLEVNEDYNTKVIWSLKE